MNDSSNLIDIIPTDPMIVIPNDDDYQYCPILVAQSCHPMMRHAPPPQIANICTPESAQQRKGLTLEKQVVKKVQFSSNIEIIEIEHVNDMSIEETELRWISKTEFRRIKKDILFHIDLGQRYGVLCDNNNDSLFNHDHIIFTLRGIRSKNAQEERRQDQHQTVQAVLNEQFLQRSEGFRQNPDLIAMMYNVLSYPCQQRAFEIGMNDSLYVYGSYDQYKDNPNCKNVLYEDMPMDSDVFYVKDNIVHQLVPQGQRMNGGGNASVEDWLLERFQKGERMSNFRTFSTRVPPHIPR
jgi:hypothetical protein